MQRLKFGFLLCAAATFGCSSADTGDSDMSTTAPQTTSATDPTTGSTGVPTTDPTPDPDGTSSDGTTGPAPTTDATTGPVTTSDGTTGDATTGDGTTGDGTTGAAAVTASAVLGPKSGSQVTGTVLFTDIGGGMADLVIELSNVSPGTHALHIHQIPDCSADDGTSTGDHWNPNGTMLGELGTVEIGDDGTGTFMKTDAWSIGTGQFDDVDAHSIIIHADPNGGTRIACGVIAKD